MATARRRFPWTRVRERLDEGLTQATDGRDRHTCWLATVPDGALYAEFSAPSAGPPPWDVYEVTPATVFALGTVEPYGATRWRF